MSKNYLQRPVSASKPNIIKLIEPPGFNLNNVIIDKDTNSPRLLSTHSYNGMRKLTKE